MAKFIVKVVENWEIELDEKEMAELRRDWKQDGSDLWDVVRNKGQHQFTDVTVSKKK